MARGWESKSVADQIEAAGESWREEVDEPTDVSPEVLARRERAATLNLSRSRTLEQLEHATNPAYRATLLRALSAIDAEIEDLLEAQ